MIGVRERLHDRERLRGIARGFWRARLERARAYAWPVVQVAMAAAISWQIAHALLPTSQPVFAAVMAVNALGISVGQRGRLAFETVLGVATGIGVASLALDAVGSGAVQLAVLTALAMTLALVIGGGTTFVAQAGVWAILVATFRGPGHLYPEALFETLIGGAVALVFSQLLFPLDPVSTSSRALRTVLGSLSAGLRAGRDAVRDGDEEVAARARLALADLDAHIAELSDALAMSAGAARLAPFRRRDRAQVESVGRVAPHLDLAAQDTGSLLAAIARLVRHQENAPELEEGLECLAAAADLLGEGLDDQHAEAARGKAQESVAHAPDEFDPQGTPAALVCWSLLQSTALHLLVAAGTPEDDARAVLAETTGSRSQQVFGRLV
ncbi:MAG TPA: FUSC family protein [Gaiellales bacterium]|nr:FUSC family protein [Gaiellales bacterium]